jgi:hypothetical protein
MTPSSLSAASPLPVAVGLAPQSPLMSAGTSALSSAEGLDAGTHDLTELLASVNSLQSLAGALGGAGGSSGVFEPTIPPYKPIDQIDQRTVRDSIPDDSGSAQAA